MDELTPELFRQESWLAYLVYPAIAIAAGLLLSYLFFMLLKFGNERKPTVLKEQLLQRLKRRREEENLKETNELQRIRIKNLVSTFEKQI